MAPRTGRAACGAVMRGSGAPQRGGGTASRACGAPRHGDGAALRVRGASEDQGAGRVLFDIDGVPVRVERKRVRNLNLRIARDGSEVRMSVPPRMSFAEAEAFARSRERWIRDKLREVAASPAAQAANASAEDVAQWRAVVQACVPALIEAWEPIMGVKAGSLAYRNMSSRWGSCQPATGRICINVRLALYPPECLEYVVVHELCHLLERGHGPRFKALMDAFMPDWRTRRAKLR